MRINFRQGLISFQKDNGSAIFLHPSTTSGFITHVVSPTPTVVAVAHGDSDYLLHFDRQVDNAWGPITSGTNNYLFWDVDLLTAEVTYGITLVSPIVSAIEPPKVHDQHWFDVTTTTMKVWNAARNKWQVKARVFAGTVVNGNTSNIVHQLQGTQATLDVPGNPGFIMRDTLLQPLRKSNGEFLTDDTHVRVETTVGTSGVLVQPVNRIIPVRAGENIPAMSLVYFSDDDTIRLASSNPALTPARIPVGIMLEGITAGDVGHMSPFGEITYDQWDWSGHAGKPLYVDQAGQLTLDRPSGVFAYRAGFVKNKNTVLLGIDAETYPQVYQADVNSLIIVGAEPVKVADGVNGLGERVVTVSVDDATPQKSGLLSSTKALQLDTNTAAISQLQDGVADLQATKADNDHAHLIASITGLQTTLDSKSDVGHIHNEYAAIDHTHEGYAQVGHNHTLPEITGLQTELNNKANRTHLNSFNEVYSSVDRGGMYDVGQGQTLSDALGQKADVAHVHPIAAVSGLQAELDGKASTAHTHQITEIPGLQTELDNRAFVVHSHAMSQVSGLNTALSAKADVVHNHDSTYAPIEHAHEIADVGGLQTALEGKSDITHNHDGVYALAQHAHEVTDVIGLETALDGKAAASHVHEIAGVTGLQSALDSKADLAHAHEIASINGLQPALDSKAAVSHTHVSSDITDLKQTVASQFVAGDNISLSVAADNTVTINSTASGGSTSFTVSNGSMFEDVQRFNVPFDFGEIVFPNLDVDQSSGTVSIPPILFANAYNGSVVQTFPNANATPFHRMQIVFGTGLQAQVTGQWGESLLVTATGGTGGTSTIPSFLRYLAADGNLSAGSATGDTGPIPEHGNTSVWNSDNQTWEATSNIRVDAQKNVYINYPTYIDNPDGSTTTIPVANTNSSILMMSGGDAQDRPFTGSEFILSSPGMTGDAGWFGIRAGDSYDDISAGGGHLIGGYANGTGSGGSIVVESGSSQDGSPGDVIIRTGTTNSEAFTAVPGSIQLQTGGELPRLRILRDGTFVFDNQKRWLFITNEGQSAGSPGQVVTQRPDGTVGWSGVSIENVQGLSTALNDLQAEAGVKVVGFVAEGQGSSAICTSHTLSSERVVKYIITLTSGETAIQMTELTSLKVSSDNVQTQIVSQLGNTTLGTFTVGIDVGAFTLVFNKTVDEIVDYTVIAKYF